jgi:colanic acid biosynthesis glycosyl transferase WcaI
MEFRIVPISAEHIRQVVQIHMSAFPNFFLTFLGPRFLEEFYGSFAVDPAGIGFVGQDVHTKQVYGAVVGPFNPAGYFKRLLKRRWWAFCIASSTAVLKKPTVTPRLFRAVFYRGDAPSGRQDISLLSSIAVSPNIQTKGIGRALVGAFLGEVKKRGGKGVFLTTDAKDNDKVNRFYQNLRFKLESSHLTPEGREMNRYVFYFD